MKPLDLENPHAFPSLIANSKALNGLFLQPDPDVDELLALVQERAELIAAHLGTLAPEQKKAFAQAELACNKLILERVDPLLAETGTELVKLSKAKKAIQKYKR